MKGKIIFSNIEQLRKGFRMIRVSSYPSIFELNIDNLTENDNIIFAQRIKNNTKKCGCNMGKVFLGVFVFFYGGLILTFSLKFPTGSYLINCLAFATLGAFVGKIYGLIVANLKISKIIDEIEKNETSKAGEPETA